MGSMSGDELANWDAQSTSGHEERIYVSVRVRPLNEKETSRNDVSDWECINNNTIVYKNSIADRSMFPAAYTFDRVFSWDHSTKQVYDEGAREVTLSVLSGINSTVFAYGQTNSGKTYTMSGITDLTVADIYDYIDKHNDREFVLKFSAMEIYNEAVRDLLSTDSTPLRLLDDPERGTVVEKLTEEVLRDVNHLKELLAVCEAQRKIGETNLNELSSRSHQILRLTIESSAREFKGANSSTLTASVNFVDLAGSERASQTLSAGARLKEGCHINRSLLTLGTVIRKLSKGRSGHVPYRDSKLTRILQNSLGGNARTAIICTMSPARSLVEQSRNTLFFASCAKQVSTNAQVNLVMSDKALVKQLQRELIRMENEVKSLALKSSLPTSSAALKEKELLIEKMEKEIKELKQQRDFAEARVQDLLRSVAAYQGPRSPPTDHIGSDMKSSPIGKYLVSESSSHPSPHYDRSDSLIDKPNFLLHDQSEDTFLSSDISPRQAIDEFFGPDPSQGWEMTHDEDCKEVRCVQVENPRNERNIVSHVIASPEKDQVGSEPSYDALKKKIQEMQQTIDYLANPILMAPSPPSSSEGNTSVTRSMAFSRSRSCRAVLTPTSHWFERSQRSTFTPPRPEGCFSQRQFHIARATSLEEFNLEGSSSASCMRKERRANLSCDSDVLDRFEINNSGFQYGPGNDFHLPFEGASVGVKDTTSSEKKAKKRNLSCGSDILMGHELKNSGFQDGPSMKDLNGGKEEKEQNTKITRENDYELEQSGSKRAPSMEELTGEGENDFSVNGASSDEKDKNTNISGENDFSGGYQLEHADCSSSPMSEQNMDILGETNVYSGQSSATKSDEVIVYVDHSEESFEYDEVPASVHHSGDSSVEDAKMSTKETENCGEDSKLDSVQGPKDSTSDWVAEFETRQKRIIELWEACHVPLTHRTQFFLLFKGDDPSDSVYFEVELRRLSFLKNTLSRGKKVLMDGQILTPELSKRALHRERQLLSKQMLRMFSTKERETLYQKWDIKVNSKQRRQQLCHRVWTDTKDMNHVRESAALVAKLVGFAEESQIPKEMFGLSFSRRPVGHHRSFSWKPSMPLNL